MATVTLIRRRPARDRTWCFPDAARAGDFLARFIVDNLYEVFVSGCEVAAPGAGLEPIDMLANVELVADGGAVHFTPDAMEVRDQDHAAEYAAHPEYDIWDERDRTVLINFAAVEALKNLAFLVNATETWDGATKCRLTDLVYAGKDGPPLFAEIELRFNFPGLPI